MDRQTIKIDILKPGATYGTAREVTVVHAPSDYKLTADLPAKTKRELEWIKWAVQSIHLQKVQVSK